MSIYGILLIGVAIWVGWSFMSQAGAGRREMDRLGNSRKSLLHDAQSQLDAAFSTLAAKKSKRQTLGYHAKKSEKDLEQKLNDAGLENAKDQGKFFLLRTVCYVSGPSLGAVCYLYMIPYYATISALICSMIGILVPFFWLKAKINSRTEEIQRELPLVLDLTNLGTSAGWDVASALERVVDALYVEFPGHPLIKELKKARWLTTSGCTWEEALKKVSMKLGDDSVKRSTLALSQAIKQGGDRTKQLEAIATDAQRSYYAQLDKRLAGLPIKVVLITMFLLLALMLVLMAPAAVQVKNVILS